MKLFILIALLAPVVASSFKDTAKYEYITTKNCGGYNSTLSIKNCPDDKFCVSRVDKEINGTLIFKFGDEIKEPLFFSYSAAQYRDGKRVTSRYAINGSDFLCNLIECPYKPGIEYRLNLQIPVFHYVYSKDMVRVTAVVNTVNDDVEVCASRDIVQYT